MTTYEDCSPRWPARTVGNWPRRPVTRLPNLRHLLAGAKWQSDDIHDDLQQYLADKLGEVSGVPIVDGTGFIKKGITSAGVQRQYSGTAGARISISARQRGVGGSLRYDPVSVRPRCRSCSAGQVRSDPAALR
ncbi:transposase [Streptomyces fuscichromogenes]|uniref:transposase n=1 Tax=Streptomyces fuscichromogenes TaxID=1324013 RepID=UPI003814C557